MKRIVYYFLVITMGVSMSQVMRAQTPDPLLPPPRGTIFQRTLPSDWEFKGVFALETGYYNGQVGVETLTSSLDSFQNAVIGIQNIANGIYGENDFVISHEGSEVGKAGMRAIPKVGVEIRYLRTWGMGLFVGPSAYEKKSLSFELWGSYSYTYDIVASDWAFIAEAKLGLLLDQGKALSPSELIIAMNHEVYQESFAPLFFDLGARDSIPYEDRVAAAHLLTRHMDTYVQILNEEIRKDKKPRGGGFMLMTDVSIKAQIWPNIKWASICIEAGPFLGINNMNWISPKNENQRWHYGVKLAVRMGP